MPYVLRNAEGKIIRASVRHLHGAEHAPHSNLDVVEFLKSNKQDPKEVEDTLAELYVTDIEMSRGIEDLIMVLLRKSVIKMLDLPTQLQDRMALRGRLRKRLEDAYEKASRTADEQKTPAGPGPAHVLAQMETKLARAQ